MISDATGRYCLGSIAGDDGEAFLVRYDRRWRTIREVPLRSETQDVRVHVVEGRHAIAVIAHRREDDAYEVSVRGALRPHEPRAVGIFKAGKWDFLGDSQAWGDVPEHLVLSDSAGVQFLVRIADEPRVQELGDSLKARHAVDIPGSRLVVLACAGSFVVLDAHSGRQIRSIELKEKNPAPIVGVRGDELWVNDVDTMLKFDTLRFDIIDAAGSQVVDNNDGTIASWSFVANDELCLVVREAMGDAILLDAVTMAPVGHATFGAQDGPRSATLVGRNAVVALGTNNRVLRSRASRVKLPPASVADAP